VARAATVVVLEVGRSIPPRTRDARDTGMKSTLRWYAYRATMFLGTIAAGFLVIDSAKRW
jgi:hypothetical protein